MPLYFTGSQINQISSTPSFAGATLDMNFTTGVYVGAGLSNLTVTRAGTNATDLTYDQTSRTNYNVFSANTPRRVADGRGLLVEESRTQYLGVTDTPATQTTSSLGTGSYTLWVIGSGSAAVTAGTATITGGGSATAGTPLTFSVTGAGTVVVTKTGALTYFQLEKGAFPTSYIPNAGAAGSTSVRVVDNVTLTGSAFTNWYTGGTSGAVYTEIQGNSTFALNPLLWTISDGTTNNYHYSSVTGSATVNFKTVAAATDQGFVITGNTIPIQTTAKTALTYAPADRAIVANGSTVATGVGTMPTGINQILLGQFVAGGNALNSFIRRIAYFPSRLSNATLMSITT